MPTTVTLQFEIELDPRVALDAAFAHEAIQASFEGRTEGQLWFCGDLGVWQSYPAGTVACEGPFHYKVRVAQWRLS